MLKSVELQRCKLVREQNIEYDSVNDCTDIVNLMRMLGYADAAEEYMILICLRTDMSVCAIHEISHGDLSHTICSPRAIFQRALLNNAYGIILVHNHPSQNCTESTDDINCTKNIAEAGRIMGIPLIDHIIVSTNDYTSFHNEGLI